MLKIIVFVCKQLPTGTQYFHTVNLTLSAFLIKLISNSMKFIKKNNQISFRLMIKINRMTAAVLPWLLIKTRDHNRNSVYLLCYFESYLKTEQYLIVNRQND